MADSTEEAADLMTAVKRVLCNIGLSMNESKTKYMTGIVEPGYIQSLSGKYIGKAENFNYLVSRIGSTEDDIPSAESTGLGNMSQASKSVDI